MINHEALHNQNGLTDQRSFLAKFFIESQPMGILFGLSPMDEITLSFPYRRSGA